MYNSTPEQRRNAQVQALDAALPRAVPIPAADRTQARRQPRGRRGSRPVLTLRADRQVRSRRRLPAPGLGHACIAAPLLGASPRVSRRPPPGQEAAPDSAGRSFTAESIPSGDTGPEQLIELVEDARTRLAALKPAERRALSLIAAGFSYAEIGAMNEWTFTKVNRCIAEGRAALRSGQRDV